MNLDELITHLVEVRKERGITQIELAQMMGTTHSHISRLETRKQDPELATLNRWAEALGKTYGHTVEGSNVKAA